MGCVVSIYPASNVLKVIFIRRYDDEGLDSIDQLNGICYLAGNLSASLAPWHLLKSLNGHLWSFVCEDVSHLGKVGIFVDMTGCHRVDGGPSSRRDLYHRLDMLGRWGGVYWFFRLSPLGIPIFHHR